MKYIHPYVLGRVGMIQQVLRNGRVVCHEITRQTWNSNISRAKLLQGGFRPSWYDLTGLNGFQPLAVPSLLTRVSSKLPDKAFCEMLLR